MFFLSHLTIVAFLLLLFVLPIEQAEAADKICEVHSVGPYKMMYELLMKTSRDSNCALNIQYREDELTDDMEKFDYIVVGAGSAGSAVANRLSANPDWSVLLIEAGGKPPVEVDISGYTHGARTGISFEWDYRTEKSMFSCKAMNDGQCRWPRGKMLGGSSSLNGLLYVRGNRADYDGWAAAGNRGWSYDEVYPFFKKMENYTAVQSGLHNDHGYDGYLHIEPYRERIISSVEKMRKLLIGAAKEVGLLFVKDMNANQTLGITVMPGTMKNGVRDNAAKAYVSSVANRPNLKVLLNTTVLRVLIEKNTRQVYGVEYLKSGSSKKVICTKEVIVSAGAINSPQLLMLSGVGPSDHLKKFNIPIVKDLPGVGQNLQDHIMFYGFPVVLSEDFNRIPPSDRDITGEDILHFYLTRRTDLASMGTLDTMMFIKTTGQGNNNVNGNDKIPDVQLHTLNFPTVAAYEEFLMYSLNVNESLLQRSTITKDSQVMVLCPTLLVPKSRGQILLHSSDPLDPPKIISGYLTESEDVETLLRGIEFALRIVNTNAVKKFGKPMKVNVGDCGNSTARFDKNYWTCLLRHLGSTVYHQVGTCKMGPSSDPLAVVDNRLKVFGVNGLRVVDASVMPVIIRGNTNIPTIMTAERASEFIIEDGYNF